MPDRSFLDWPFFDDSHRAFAAGLEHWAAREIGSEVANHDEATVGAAARRYVRMLGEGGWLRHVVPDSRGGVLGALDVRTLCLARETLARYDGLADFAFAMQGLGAGPISLFGSEKLKRRYLPPVASGEEIAAFAISERLAGSHIGAMTTTARDDGDAWVIDGEKTWISNAGIADWYVVFARTHGVERTFGAFVVEAGDPGFRVTELVPVSAPHPLGTLAFSGCRIPKDRAVGAPSHGLKVALATLDVFRSTVGAAALGFARRALDDAICHARSRVAFGKPLSDLQLVQEKVADMATAIDASALLVYRAAWTRDRVAPRITREAAMAKLFATESAQRVVDDAVQLLGARGVVHGETVERLYREVRALRIYEGTSEIQKLVIAGQVMAPSSQSAESAAGASDRTDA